MAPRESELRNGSLAECNCAGGGVANLDTSQCPDWREFCVLTTVAIVQYEFPICFAQRNSSIHLRHAEPFPGRESHAQCWSGLCLCHAVMTLSDKWL